MAMLRKGAPTKNTFGSLQRCDTVIDCKPCPNRAAFTLIPDHIQGQNFTVTYFCGAHANYTWAR